MLTHGTLTVGIVGAGRVGRALGHGLRAAGWRVGPVVTRRLSTARLAVRAIGDGQPYATLTRQLLAVDLVLVCATDAEISGVAKRLAELGGQEWRGRTVLHASGRLDSRELRPLGERGAATGSLHPVQIFNRRGMTPLEGCFFVIEGSPTALRAARRICRDLGGVPLSVPASGKSAIHAARSFVSAFLAASFETATRILMAHGFTRRQATRVLEPLARRTLDNVLRLGPQAVASGATHAPRAHRIPRGGAALRRFPRSYRDAYSALERLRNALGDSRAPKKSNGNGHEHAIHGGPREGKHLEEERI
ncbi:MAG: DUF2520 domain-containing protein [Candidatus Acidiferrales bacterium]